MLGGEWENELCQRRDAASVAEQITSKLRRGPAPVVSTLNTTFFLGVRGSERKRTRHGAESSKKMKSLGFSLQKSIKRRSDASKVDEFVNGGWAVCSNNLSN